MTKIVDFIKREPVTLLGALAVIIQGVVQEATADGVTSWSQLVTLLGAILARRFVSPVAPKP